jgi:hypothetical protein
VKGAVHADIVIAVILHAAFTALMCYWQVEKNGRLSIPSSVVPSLSIVVGLMLVFRKYGPPISKGAQLSNTTQAMAQATIASGKETNSSQQS